MQRKHRKQMTVAEISSVESIVKSVPAWHSQPYYAMRAQTRKIARFDVFRAIAYGQVIEAKDDGRAVMRGQDGTCVVVSVPTRTVITVWYNDPSDNHYTLDLSQYTWYTDLTKWQENCK